MADTSQQVRLMIETFHISCFYHTNIIPNFILVSGFLLDFTIYMYNMYIYIPLYTIPFSKIRDEEFAVENHHVSRVFISKQM